MHQRTRSVSPLKLYICGASCLSPLPLSLIISLYVFCNKDVRSRYSWMDARPRCTTTKYRSWIRFIWCFWCRLTSIANIYIILILHIYLSRNRRRRRRRRSSRSSRYLDFRRGARFWWCFWIVILVPILFPIMLLCWRTHTHTHKHSLRECYMFVYMRWRLLG